MSTTITTNALRDDVRNLKSVLSRNMKRRRAALGLTQEKLAEKVGMSIETIAKLEGGKQWFSVESLAQICRALEITPCQLFLDTRRDFLVPVAEISGLIDKYTVPPPPDANPGYRVANTRRGEDGLPD